MTDFKGYEYRVLDKGFVELQSIMGDDLAIVNAARTSYLGESKGEAADKKLLFYLMEHGHTTPFEMVEFKFRVKAPLIVTQQWMRHRMWSYNSSSARYTEADDDDFYIPTEWRGQDNKNKQGSVGTVSDNRYWHETLEIHTRQGYELYQNALENGIAREQARLFLPGFAYYYTFVAKVDAHNLMHFLKLRMDSHAQWEIRQYAETIYKQIFKPMLPWTAEAFERYVLT